MHEEHASEMIHKSEEPVSVAMGKCGYCGVRMEMTKDEGCGDTADCHHSGVCSGAIKLFQKINLI